jgi:hypothetical protein
MEATLLRWRETYERSVELADVSITLLDTLMVYCKCHNIPLYREQGIWNLVSRAQSTVKEIENLHSSKLPKLSDEWKHGRKSDGEVPEPEITTHLRLVLFSSLG